MRSRRREEQPDPIGVAEARLREFVEREAQARHEELQRALAIARAESTSLLAQEERRLARELERAVDSFVREGERVLNERLLELGEAGLQRLVRSWGPADRRTTVGSNFPGEGSSEQERNSGT